MCLTFFVIGIYLFHGPKGQNQKENKKYVFQWLSPRCEGLKIMMSLDSSLLSNAKPGKGPKLRFNFNI